MILDLVLLGYGWAELRLSVVGKRAKSGGLVRLDYAFQQSDALEGLDLGAFLARPGNGFSAGF